MRNIFEFVAARKSTMSGKVYIECKHKQTGETFKSEVKGSPEQREALYKYCMSDFSCRRLVIAEYDYVNSAGVPQGAVFCKLENI